MTQTSAVAEPLPWKRIQQRIQELEVREQVLKDIHVALGVQWGEDPYARIQQLLRTDVIVRAAEAIIDAIGAAIDEPIIEAAKRLRRERDEAQKDYTQACRTIAEMHAAAVGEVRGPTLGVIEDVAAVRVRLEMYQLELRKLRDADRPLTVHDFLTICRVIATGPHPDEDPDRFIAELQRTLTGQTAESGIEASPSA